MNQVIEKYELLSDITGRMREAAVHSEWDRLCELENQCREHVQTMQTADSGMPVLSETSRQRKIELIHKILDDDAEIRNRTELWMAQLQRVMRLSKNEQLLRQSYSAK